MKPIYKIAYLAFMFIIAFVFLVLPIYFFAKSDLSNPIMVTVYVFWFFLGIAFELILIGALRILMSDDVNKKILSGGGA